MPEVEREQLFGTVTPEHEVARQVPGNRAPLMEVDDFARSPYLKERRPEPAFAASGGEPEFPKLRGHLHPNRKLAVGDLLGIDRRPETEVAQTRAEVRAAHRRSHF